MAKASDNPFPSLLLVEQASAPATPAAGQARLYRGTDNKLYIVDDAGVATEVGAGAGGGGGGDASWTAPSLTNGWLNYGSPFSTAGYRKDASGYVHLKGVLKSGTTAAAFTLPAGYRPSETRLFAVAANANFGQVNISAAGEVTLSSGWVSGGNFAVDGITFLAEL